MRARRLPKAPPRTQLRLTLVVAAVCGLASNACDDSDDDKDMEEGAANVCEAGVTYAAVAKPVLEQYCLGCHSDQVSGAGRRSAPDDVNFDSESDVFEHGGHVYEEVTTNAMPPDDAGVPKLPSMARAALLDWLECSGASAHGHDHEE